eukprot:scaffold49911_cov34-Prasinocladus_malaysianus.AAC.1
MHCGGLLEKLWCSPRPAAACLTSAGMVGMSVVNGRIRSSSDQSIALIVKIVRYFMSFLQIARQMDAAGLRRLANVRSANFPPEATGKHESLIQDTYPCEQPLHSRSGNDLVMHVF